MKRQLSLVLALVMILGTFTSVFADTTVDADAAKVASEFLKKQGVLVGDTTGDLGLGKNLLRQDTVVLVSKLMGAFDEAKAFEEEGKPTYEDVRDPFYLPLLAWAQANETFVGHSDAKFGFGENLTAQEYAKVLLVALEYTVGPEGDKDVAWKDALVKATELGLLKDVEAENATEILRSQMAVMTFNALGAKVKGGDKTLAEKLGIEMPKAPEADVLTAKVNDTENLVEVVVELSNAKLADEDKLTNTSNYRIDKFIIEEARLDGNNVVLLLNKALVKGRAYDLNVRGVQKEVDGKYSFKAYDNTSPKVDDVVILGEYGIKLVTSEPVQLPAERNFLVDGKNVAMQVEQYGRNIILSPYHKSAFSANAETLTVKTLTDFSGYTASLEEFDIKIVKDDVAPEVVDVVLKGNKVEVTFDKDIYADSVSGYVNRKDVGNISYKEGRQDIYTKEEAVIDGKTVNYGKKIGTNKVEYEFKDVLRRGTELTIVGVQNHSKVEMEKTTMVVREVKDDLEPVVVDIKKTNDVDLKGATITIEFDKDIDGAIGDTLNNNPAKIAEHFALYTEQVASRYKEKATDVFVSARKTDSKTIELKLKGLNENNKEKKYDYILEIFGFYSSGSRNKMYTEYYEFELKKANVFEVVNVSYSKNTKDETEISIEFSRPVDRVRAEDETNYLFRKLATDKPKDVKDLEGRVIVERDGKTVTLALPEFKGEGYNLLEVLAVLRDNDGNKLSDSVNVNLNDISAAAALEVEGATVTYLGNANYVVTVKKGVTSIALNTAIEGTFRINGDLTNLTVNAANAHVVVPAGTVVDAINVKLISENSLEILGKVNKIVVETVKQFNVFGEVKDLVIEAKGVEAKVKVGKTAALAEAITVADGNEVLLDEEGKLSALTVKEVSAVNETGKVTVTLNRPLLAGEAKPVVTADKGVTYNAGTVDAENATKYVYVASNLPAKTAEVQTVTVKVNEDEATTTFTISANEKVATPEITVKGTATNREADVKFTVKAVEGVTFYYTLDGTAPTSEATKYEGEVTLTAPELDEEKAITIKVIGIKADSPNSDVAEATVTYAAKPGTP